jgi:hypothetical protein
VAAGVGRRGNDGQAVLAGLLLDPAVGVAGESAEVVGGDERGLAARAEDGDDAAADRQGAEVAVQQQAVEAARTEGDGGGVLAEEAVQGG